MRSHFTKSPGMAKRFELGYFNIRKAFVRYQGPPEDMVELRSSLRLMSEPSEVRNAVAQLVRDGKAEFLKRRRNEDRAAYRAIYKGAIIYFDYSNRDDCILPWLGPVVREEGRRSGMAQFKLTHYHPL